MKSIRVSVVLALPSKQEVLALDVPEGSTVADALRAAGFDRRAAGEAWRDARCGVWSRECPPQTPLREGDRVELYRPLQADPKLQRRTRAKPTRKGI